MIIKCKMCGGNLSIIDESSVCECEFCGSRQTIPNVDNEKKTNLFNRATRLRMNSEFDKAAAIYEQIIAEFPEEAEAYWGLCLCSYGIEYVDDPSTGEKKPTCHRTSPLSIMEDSNFEQACDNADVVARRVYRDEAKAIDRIQKEILSIASKEDPYDVFICYKETAEDGTRTEDSVLSQEIYDALSEKGLKVFFSRITLESKLGEQYEPYIYAALSSARVMITVGTQYEYFDAVWVKNEWSRFLSMMKTDRQKKLIPCYKDLDAYDMPKEFKGLQAQDMGKIGWLQDLIRGVLKLCEKDNTKESKTSLTSEKNEIVPLIKRTRMFLQDQEWSRAEEYVNRILDIDPECSNAYLLQAMTKHRCINESALWRIENDLSVDKDIVRARQYCKNDENKIIEDIIEKNRLQIERSKIVQVLNHRIKELESLTEFIPKMDKRLENAKSIKECELVRDILNRKVSLPGIKELLEKCDRRETELLSTIENEIHSTDSIFECESIIKNKLSEYLLLPKVSDVRKKCNERIAILRSQINETQNLLEKKASIDKAAYEKIRILDDAQSKYNAAIEQNRKEVSEISGQLDGLRQKETLLKKSISSLTEEYNNLRGLFVGKKKAELELKIQIHRQELSSLLPNIDEAEMKLRDKQNVLFSPPEKDEIYYEIAMMYNSEKLWLYAYRYLEAIRGYRDSEIIMNEPELRKASTESEQYDNYLKSFSTKGSVVDFGKQTEWIVLDRKDNKVLLISKEIIGTERYNAFSTYVTWENCSLRKWLNTKWFNSFFSDIERLSVVTSVVDNSNHQSDSKYRTDAGNNTSDNVFVLSYAEVKKYILSNITPKLHSKYKSLGWWTRTPGQALNWVYYVKGDGTLDTNLVAFDTIHVRSALWLDLDAYYLSVVRRTALGE